MQTQARWADDYGMPGLQCQWPSQPCKQWQPLGNHWEHGGSNGSGVQWGAHPKTCCLLCECMCACR